MSNRFSKVCKKITNCLCLNRNNVKSDKSQFKILNCTRNPIYHPNQVKENGYIQYSIDEKNSKQFIKLEKTQKYFEFFQVYNNISSLSRAPV